MTLDEFIMEQFQLIADFETYWEKEHLENPTDYTLELSSVVEWQDKLNMFLEEK